MLLYTFTCSLSIAFILIKEILFSEFYNFVNQKIKKKIKKNDKRDDKRDDKNISLSKMNRSTIILV